jgi:hypothetical protein
MRARKLATSLCLSGEENTEKCRNFQCASSDNLATSARLAKNSLKYKLKQSLKDCRKPDVLDVLLWFGHIIYVDYKT